MLKNQFPPNIAHTKHYTYTVIVSISLLKWFFFLDCVYLSGLEWINLQKYKASKDNYLVADSAYSKSLEFKKKSPN